MPYSDYARTVDPPKKDNISDHVRIIFLALVVTQGDITREPQRKKQISLYREKSECKNINYRIIKKLRFLSTSNVRNGNRNNLIVTSSEAKSILYRSNASTLTADYNKG